MFLLIISALISGSAFARSYGRPFNSSEYRYILIGSILVDSIFQILGSFNALSMVKTAKSSPDVIVGIIIVVLISIACDALILAFMYSSRVVSRFVTKESANWHELRSILVALVTKRAMHKPLMIIIIITSTIILFFCDIFFSNFLPNLNYIDALVFIVPITAIACVVWISKKEKDPIAQNYNKSNLPIIKNRWSRLLLILFTLVLFFFPVFRGALPWLYTSMTGTEGELLVMVKGWESEGRLKCSKPQICNVSLLQPANSLCVGKSDRDKYPVGTVLKLKGKKSIFGVV